MVEWKKLDKEWYEKANRCPYDGSLCLDGCKEDVAEDVDAIGADCWMWIKGKCDLCAVEIDRSCDLFENYPRPNFDEDQ